MKIRSMCFVAISLAAGPALADEGHTASWYANHPHEMRAMIAACNDDPGHARHNPNCANASQGESILDEQREMAAFEGLSEQVTSEMEKNWRANPRSLLTQLKMCNAIASAEVRRNMDCDLAFGVAQKLTGHN